MPAGIGQRDPGHRLLADHDELGLGDVARGQEWRRLGEEIGHVLGLEVVRPLLGEVDLDASGRTPVQRHLDGDGMLGDPEVARHRGHRAPSVSNWGDSSGQSEGASVCFEATSRLLRLVRRLGGELELLVHLLEELLGLLRVALHVVLVGLLRRLDLLVGLRESFCAAAMFGCFFALTLRTGSLASAELPARSAAHRPIDVTSFIISDLLGIAFDEPSCREHTISRLPGARQTDA